MWKSVAIDRKQPTDKWLDVYVQYLFALFDMSGKWSIIKSYIHTQYVGDGRIDRNEYIQAMAIYGCDRQEAAAAFDHFSQVFHIEMFSAK